MQATVGRGVSRYNQRQNKTLRFGGVVSTFTLQPVRMSDVVFVLFVEFIVRYAVERLSPEGYGFIDGKTEYLSRISV